MTVLQDRTVFENYFSSPADRQKAIERKMAAYEQVFLPEYLKLMESELEKRKKERQEHKNQEKGGRPTPGEQGKDVISDSVPLTKEEEQELIDQLLKEMEEYGKQLESAAPSDEETNNKSKLFDDIGKLLKDRSDRIKRGEQPESPKLEEAEPKRGEEAIKNAAKGFERKAREKAEMGLAESLQVRQESVKQWNKIKDQCRIEIESLTINLSELFLDDRRKRLEYLMREGEIIPGLEYETVAAVLSGEVDPQTKMREIQNPEFLETEIEFVVDTSGSMSGIKIEESIKMMVIVVEAFKKIIEDLRNEDLLIEDEKPFRIGVVKFSTIPERVSRLSEPLDDRKELTIIDKVSEVGGGTEETGGLREAYESLKLGKDNVIKMIFILTDGAGNVEGVRPIIQQIEKDDKVIFLAVGLGDKEGDGNAIIQTYLEPLKSREANVFGISADDPKEIMPKVLQFIKREIEKRRKSY
jgi:uncharacterized protein YegL